MKLLIYGGCHANVLKSLIDRLGPPGAHTVDDLINFKLIASGDPFPVDELQHYDAVLYSPIENKGGYNTTFLVADCASAGVPVLCFPWLEWRGYAPTSDKGEFDGCLQWFFPDLFEIRDGFSTADAFSRFVRAEYPSCEAIRRNTEYSTCMLADLENRNGCEITISDFIEAEFRDRRLFISPDHPALAIYRSVIEQAERALGTCLVATWPADLPDPQLEVRTPILPQIGACHGLHFSDTMWRAENRPGQDVDLDDYLALYFHHEGRGTDLPGRRDRNPGNPRTATTPEPVVTAPEYAL